MSVAVVTQHTKRMFRIILSSVNFPALSMFFHVIPHTERFSRGGVTENKTCVLCFFTNLSETFLILRRTQPDIIINPHPANVENKVSS